MNRDEQKSRPGAVPPMIETSPGLRRLYPREPSGGTWIGLNDQGLVLALLNWYSPQAPQTGRMSRGTLIPRLLHLSSPAALVASLSGMDWSPFNPCRLLAFHSGSREIVEWAWNGIDIQKTDFPWTRHHWFSSGFREPEVTRVRSQTIDELSASSAVGSWAWIRDVHASHQPERGAYSVCVHRSDAETVSCTEIAIETATARMRYQAGPPCGHAYGAGPEHILTLQSGLPSV